MSDVVGLDMRKEQESFLDLSDDPPEDWSPEEIEEFEADMSYLFSEGFVFQGEDGGFYANE